MQLLIMKQHFYNYASVAPGVLMFAGVFIVFTFKNVFYKTINWEHSGH